MIDGKDFLNQMDRLHLQMKLTNQLLTALLKAVEKLLAIEETERG